MNPSKIFVTFPKEFRTWNHNQQRNFDKVQVIKSVRFLTGWGVKESQNASELPNRVELPILNYLSEGEFNTEIRMLKNNGVVISYPDESSVHTTIRNYLEDMAISNIRARKYDIAIEVLQYIQKM